MAWPKTKTTRRKDGGRRALQGFAVEAARAESGRCPVCHQPRGAHGPHCPFASTRGGGRAA